MFVSYFPSLTMAGAFGILAGLLSVCAYLPYIRDTFLRRTQPQRASWLIWSVLGTIAFSTQIHEGAWASLGFAAVQVSATLTVFLLSIWVGSGRFLDRSDYHILGLAALGLLIWYYTETALYALALTISLSLLAGMVTVLKAYRDPDSETMNTWVVSLLAALCALISVGTLNWTLLAYPLYLFTLYGLIICALVLGQTRRAVQIGLEMDTESGTGATEEYQTGLQGAAILQTTG